MEIPFIDLSRQHKALAPDLRKAVLGVMESAHFVLGKTVSQFERDLAAAVGTRHAVALASGTDALYLSLWALGIGPGDEVITTPFSFFATAASIVRLGAKPVFADIDATTFNLDPKEVRSKISRKTKAILPVHLYGLPSSMQPLSKLAHKYSLSIVEDACQALSSFQ